MKFDPINGAPNVLTECLFLREYSETLKTVPKYNIHSTLGGRRFLVMQYLPNSVESYMAERLSKKEYRDIIVRDLAI